MSAPAAFTRRPVRHLPAPAGLGARLHRWRFGLARRLVQGTVLLLFIGTLHGGLTLFGQPLLTGNLSAARLAGTVPLADPFATLQLLAARHVLASEVLLGAVVALGLYGVLGGRVFCAWVCPMNVVTDAAAATRAALGRERAPDLARVPPATRYAVLALALLLSAVAGIAAFEAFSPVAMLQRELIYGAGLGLTGAAGIFLLDAFVLRRGWCGHLCPLGAFWTLVGKATRRAARGGVLKLAFDDASCSHCGDCVKVCPEPRALHFAELAARGQVAAGECTRCARCVAVCPESSLRFALHPAPVAPPAAAAPERLSTGAKP